MKDKRITNDEIIQEKKRAFFKKSLQMKPTIEKIDNLKLKLNELRSEANKIPKELYATLKKNNTFAYVFGDGDLASKDPLSSFYENYSGMRIPEKLLNLKRIYLHHITVNPNYSDPKWRTHQQDELRIKYKKAGLDIEVIDVLNSSSFEDEKSPLIKIFGYCHCCTDNQLIHAMGIAEEATIKYDKIIAVNDFDKDINYVYTPIGSFKEKQSYENILNEIKLSF